MTPDTVIKNMPFRTSHSGEKVLNMDKKILKLLKAVWAPK
jgi:hypothetical protein